MLHERFTEPPETPAVVAPYNGAMDTTANPIHTYLDHLLAEAVSRDSEQDAVEVVRDAYCNLYPADVAESGWNLADALDVLGDDYPSDHYDSADVQASIRTVRRLAGGCDWDALDLADAS